MESDSVVWRHVDAGDVLRISAEEYDQACFEWELAHQDVVPTNNEALRQTAPSFSWKKAERSGSKRVYKHCWNCGSTDLQHGGVDQVGAEITVCAACGERQEEV